MTYNFIRTTITPSLIAICVAFLLWPDTGAAQTVLRSSDTVSVDVDQVVEGNFYSIGDTISVSGEVLGDWFALGNTITGNGTFTEDVLLVGRNVSVHGSTTDDVRVVALEATIADAVGGDLVVVANTVKILSSATIEGDVLLLANSVEINGSVGGDVLGRAGTIRLNGPVLGAVDVTTEQLTVGERAHIHGSISYQSNQELLRAQNAVIDGSITRSDIQSEQSFGGMMERLLMLFLAVMFAALVTFLLAPQVLLRTVTYTKQQITLTMLLGFVVTILTPFLAALFIVSSLGVLVGIVMLSFYILLLALGVVLAGPLLGALLGQYVLGRPQLDLFSIIAGVTALHVLLLVPLFGLGLYIALTFAGVGSIILLLYQRRR